MTNSYHTVICSVTCGLVERPDRQCTPCVTLPTNPAPSYDSGMGYTNGTLQRVLQQNKEKIENKVDLIENKVDLIENKVDLIGKKVALLLFFFYMALSCFRTLQMSYSALLKAVHVVSYGTRHMEWTWTATMKTISVGMKD